MSSLLGKNLEIVKRKVFYIFEITFKKKLDIKENIISWEINRQKDFKSIHWLNWHIQYN